MYLYRKQYVCPELNESLRIEREGEEKFIEVGRPTRLVEEIGYWRKANQIHRWFVENVQEGTDDCREYDVSREQLATLLEIVKKVIAKSKLVPGQVSAGETLQQGKWVPIIENGQKIEDSTVAEKLLPISDGYFFGSHCYDQWYVADLHLTEQIITEALSSYHDTYFSYQSSW